MNEIKSIDFKWKEICKLPEQYFENKDIVNFLIQNNLVEYYIQKFEEYFYNIWFKRKKSLQLTWVDKTILFTNSAIVSLKEYIKNWKKIEPYFITQECIRVQNLNENINNEIKYISSFNMIWVFIPKEDYQDFINQIYTFLIEWFWYNQKDIKIVADKTHRNLLDWWEKLWKIKIEYNKENFNWKFWEWDLMKWNWFDFRVQNKKWEWTDIWNIMEIISNWKIKWYWLWLWIETLISHKNNFSNPIEFFTKKSWIKIEWNLEIHFYDTLKLLIDSYKNWIKLWKKWANFEIKKAFKKINSLLIQNTNILFDLKEKINKFESANYWKSLVWNEIFNEILKRSDFEISKKSFSILVKQTDNNENIIDDLKQKLINIELVNEYNWNNIWIQNKSLTFEIKYINTKWKSKETFKQLIKNIKNYYTIR